MHPQKQFSNPDEDQPCQATLEQQGLYNQLKMTDEDLEAWMFGEDPLDEFQPPSLSDYPRTVILGEESRLSESQLWPLIEQYYANMGVSAWDSQVPCFVTSSAYIAEAYAEMTLALLEDHYEQLDLSEPLYIVEMATGVGRFSFLYLKELEAKLACFSRFKNLKIRYIMSDFTENNVAYWEQHPALKHFLGKGMLDFAVFRPEEDKDIHLKVSGQVLSPGTLKNPLIAIANYFFDTIRQDVFRITEHQLEEGLVTLEHTLTSEAAASAFPEFSDIEPQYRYEPVSADNYYPEPALNRILAEYAKEVRFGSIIFPVGALRVIRNLQKLSGQNLMLLSSDKAFAEMNHMLLYRKHEYQVHGSFSYMVNYDAIGRLFRHSGGEYHKHRQWSTSLATVCCVATRENPPSRERLAYYSSQRLNGANPITSVMNAGPEETCKINKALATIRLNLGDSRAFCIEAPILMEEISKATFEQRHDLLELMELAGSKAFFFRGERNIGYWLAELYDRLNLPEKSLEWTEYCMDGYTEFMWEYSYMKGRALERLGQRQLALEFYRESTRLNPEFENAYLALKRLETLLSSGITPQAGNMTA